MSMTIVGTGCLAWRLFLALAIVSLLRDANLMTACAGEKLVDLSKEFVSPLDLSRAADLRGKAKVSPAILRVHSITTNSDYRRKFV